MTRRLLLALALLGAAPAAAPAQWPAEIIRQDTGPTYVFYGPYRYTRYPGSDWARVDYRVDPGPIWTFVGWAYYPWRQG